MSAPHKKSGRSPKRTPNRGTESDSSLPIPFCSLSLFKSSFALATGRRTNFLPFNSFPLPRRGNQCGDRLDLSLFLPMSSIYCCCGNCCCDDDNETRCRDWSKLPVDLTVEILRRLPDKPLAQFKCVSKAWCFLICNFCVARISPLSGLVYRSYTFAGTCMDYAPLDGSGGGELFVKSYSALLPFEPTCNDLVDCCNGLLLMVNKDSSAPPPAQYYVVNPTTKQCVAIPTNPTHLKSKYASLAFNPLESPTNYKIVRLAHNSTAASVAHPPELDVFSSITGKWVKYLAPLQPPEVYGFPWVARSVYFDGVLYVLSVAKYLLCFELNAAVTTAHNNNMNARTIKLPFSKPGGGPLDLGFIGASKDCFYYAHHVESAFLVWSLDFIVSCSSSSKSKASLQWILKHSICIDDLSRRYPQHGIINRYRISDCFMPYALHPTSEVIFLGIPSTIFSYDLKTNELKVAHQLAEDRMILNGEYVVFPYLRCPVVLNDFAKERKL